MRFKSNENQQGLGHILYVVMAIVVLGVIGFAFWGVYAINHKMNNNDIDPGLTANSGVSVAYTNCLESINDTALCNFADKYSSKAPYQATDTSSTTEGSGTLTILSDGQGNSAVTSSYNGSDSSYVLLNGATYIKDPASGMWLKYAADSPSPSTNNPADGFKISASNVTDNGTISYKEVSTGACGSQTCYKYQIIDTTQPGTTQYLWFDKQNYQLHEYYVKNSNGTNDISFSYKSVTIKAPSPVKDGS